MAANEQCSCGCGCLPIVETRGTEATKPKAEQDPKDKQTK
jgi:hypothetical protein